MGLDNRRLGLYGFDYGDDRRIREVAVALRIEVPERDAFGMMGDLEIRCRADPGFLLDVVRAMPALYGRDRERAFILAELLRRAGSAYTGRPGRDGLELRPPPGTGYVVPKAAEPPASGAGCLRAW